MGTYNLDFFTDIGVSSTLSANRVVELLGGILRPRSVIDVGCGVGSWAAAFRAAGASDVSGIDGDWVPIDKLVIPKNCFSRTDLTQPKLLNRKYDLAVCLEVAEHLPDSVAQPLVEMLSSGSDAVLFSAALPGQGGTGHLNEQWPAYWISRFAGQGYQLFDIVRPLLFDDPKVAFWYAQNMLLFVRPAALQSGTVFVSPGLDHWKGIAIVHPRFLQTALNARRLVPKEWLEYGLRQLLPDSWARLRGKPVRADPRVFAFGGEQHDRPT